MRNPCVDIVKGIAIIAVVLVHCKASFPFLGSYTCILGGMWHVPVFFTGTFVPVILAELFENLYRKFVNK